MTQFEVRFSDIPFNLSEVLRALYYDSEPNPMVREMIDELTTEIETVCRPKFCYSLFESHMEGSASINIGGACFTPGRIIRKALEEGTQHYAIIATAGAEFDRWLHQISCSGDVLMTYLADALGSEIAEATVRLACEKVEQEATAAKMQISNSYSPGYCSWHVREQQLLFSLFDEAPCGVTLNDSSLMNPIKSVSTVIAVGKQVQRQPYGCDICGLKSCYKKRTREPGS